MDFTCKWCHETKPEAEFIKRDTRAPYSASNIRCCRACNQARNRERYADPDIRAKQLAANGKWRKANPEKMGIYNKEFLARKPNNLKARSKVGHMIRRGYWLQQPCEVCGESTDVQAHHDSYAEAHWLTVRWLCKQHHEVWHQHLDPVKGPILEEPLARVSALRDEHDAIQKQVTELRRKAAALKEEAAALELEAWTEVQKRANLMFSKVFKK